MLIDTGYVPNDTILSNDVSDHQPAWLAMQDIAGEFTESAEIRTDDPQARLQDGEAKLAEDQTERAEAVPRPHKCGFCHESYTHLADLVAHNKVHRYSCLQCGKSFSSHWGLECHTRQTLYDIYQCGDCDAKFSRVDVLKRHKIQHSTTSIKYSCTHCKKWMAPNGFARKDHLTQRLRNYHHIETGESSTGKRWHYGDSQDLGFFSCCVHEGCPLFRRIEPQKWGPNRDSLFASRAEYTKHMRQQHDETPFPCTKVGCEPVNGKGYFRKRDLMKHMKREHDITEETGTGAEDMVAEDSLVSQ